jgi:beta-glucosidase
MNAGPLTVPWLKAHAPAMLQAWWLGDEGGDAIADAIFGDVNPAGRLPYTVYASEAQVPPQSEYDISKGFTYMYVKGKPLYPFGYGLSYTRFQYSNLKVSPKRLSADGTVNVSLDVENTGDRPGDEVVQLYTHNIKSAVIQPAKVLHGFQRLSLQPGETKTVSLTLPAAKLAYYDVGIHDFVVEPGKYQLMAGASSSDIRLQSTIQVTH